MSQYQEFKALCAEYLALQAKVKEFVTKHERGNVTTRAGHCLLDFMTSTEVRFDGYKDTFDERWQEWRAEQEAKKAAGGE